ncbi:MAG: DUF5818 domain-containing protein [Roseovarius sp.]
MPKALTHLTLAAAALTAGTSLASAQTACGATYQIQPGDTLYRVSQRCDVGLTRIMNLNPGLDARDLAIGQEVRLARSAGYESGDDETRQARQGDGTYRVGEGDTLYSIAQSVGVSLLELITANEDVDPSELVVGDLITLPSERQSATVGITPQSGTRGSDVTIRARNLRPNDYVTVGVGPSASDWDAIGQAQVANDGDMSARVSVPGWAEAGDTLVYVVDTDRGVTLKSARFDVTAPERDRGDRNGAEQITLEGRVGQGAECATLTTRDGDLWALTSAEIGFTEGEYVRVEGDQRAAAYCQQGLGTVRVSSLTEIDPPREEGGEGGRAEDRVTLQGRIRDGVECPVLETRDGDIWAVTSDDVRFTEGEFVRVSGTRADASFCQQGIGTVDVRTIREVSPG